MYFPTMRIRKITRDYLLSIAFWLTTSLLVAWQDYTLATAQKLIISLNDLFSLQAVRYMSIALLTPPTFYIVERWPAKSILRAAAYGIGFVPFSISFGVICAAWSKWPASTSSRESFIPFCADFAMPDGLRLNGSRLNWAIRASYSGDSGRQSAKELSGRWTKFADGMNRVLATGPLVSPA
jgi:hypothetical protein